MPTRRTRQRTVNRLDVFDDKHKAVAISGGTQLERLVRDWDRSLARQRSRRSGVPAWKIAHDGLSQALSNRGSRPSTRRPYYPRASRRSPAAHQVVTGVPFIAISSCSSREAHFADTAPMTATRGRLGSYAGTAAQNAPLQCRRTRDGLLRASQRDAALAAGDRLPPQLLAPPFTDRMAEQQLD